MIDKINIDNKMLNTIIALKLIEGIYEQGMLHTTVYKSILNDYKDIIDTGSLFCSIPKSNS